MLNLSVLLEDSAREVPDRPAVIRGPSTTQMADYRYPRLVEFRDELPMTATGKILERELAE